MTDTASTRSGVAAREIVLASAGSGKTYQLSSRMIGLLAMEVPPQEIFASTFTRKAAGEILDRVLLRLARGALDDEAATELARSMPEGVPADRLSRRGCEVLLSSVVGSLHRVQVSTLDAFFQQVGRAFALDLGLPQQWRIATAADAQRLNAAAVDAVLEEVDQGVLVELVRMAGRGSAERGVHGLLMRGVANLYEVHRMLDPSALEPWGFQPEPGGFEPADPQEIHALVDALETAELPLTKAGTVNRSWEKACAQALSDLGAGDWEGLLCRGIAKAVLAGEDTYARVEIPDPVRSACESLIRIARAELGRRYQSRMEALGRFLPEFDRRVRQLRRTEATYGFGDVTAALARGGGLARTSELYYRLDGRVRHILLDEFQDTSNQQWAVLEPLLDEVLSGYEDERAVFIVADPKQSIYGWRGGEPRLLKAIQRRYELGRRTMTRSWRSSQVVLDAVNRIFEDAEDNPVLSDYGPDVKAWKEAFAPHEAVHDLPGHVRVIAGPSEAPEYDRKNTWPRLFQFAAEEIVKLHREAPGASIGVLTRKNESAVRIMSHLRELGVEVSEEGGVPIVDSAPVLLVLELLRMADHPADALARYLVSRTPVGALVGMEGADHLDESGAARAARRLRARLLAEGYGPVLSDWERMLRHSVSARDRRRLRQLVELGFQWDERATLRPGAFVRMVECARAEDPAAARIRVMTVHRAKGLEFDAVFLPELDGFSFAGGGERLGYPFRADPGRPIERVYPAIRKDLQPLFPEVGPAVEQAREAEVRDTLSALYVGLTRARHAVHIHLAPDPEGRSSAGTAARLVRTQLTGTHEAPEETVLREEGDPCWWTASTAPERLRVPVPPAAPTRTPAPAVRLARSHGRRLVPRRAPSALEGRGRLHLGRILRRGDAAARGRGIVAHRWMEAIEWLEAGVPDDEALLDIARKSAPGLREPEALLERFRRWIEEPEIQRILSRASYGPGATVERELEIVARDGDHILEGSVDRAVYVPSSEGLRIEIFDWKTDVLQGEGSDALAARVEHYRPQLEAYVRAVCANERVEREDVGASLVFLEPGTVVRV